MKINKVPSQSDFWISDHYQSRTLYTLKFTFRSLCFKSLKILLFQRVLHRFDFHSNRTFLK